MNFSSKFRNEQNVRYLARLFYEAHADKSNTLYTLKEDDHLGYPSFYRLYLELNDPTEYRVATELLEGVDHWNMLCSSDWFQPYLAKMRYALNLKLKSEMVEKVRADANDPNSKTRTASAKFLIDRGLDVVSPDRRKAGRPSKAELQAATKDQTTNRNDIEDDYNRVVNFGRS